MSLTNIGDTTMEELTKAQQLVEIAKWVKIQNPEFTKHFKSMRSIIKFYLQLPESYDKQKSVVAYIKKNLNKDCKKWDCYLAHQSAERLSLIANSLFGFRYFKDAPYKYILRFGLSSWTLRNGEKHYEVRCDPYDRCSLYNDFKPQELGGITITIKSLSDASRAADRLLAGRIEHLGNDYESEYGSKLREAMKHNNPTGEELTEGFEIKI